MALRHVRYITSINDLGFIAADVYEVSKVVHSRKVGFGESR